MSKQDEFEWLRERAMPVEGVVPDAMAQRIVDACKTENTEAVARKQVRAIAATKDDFAAPAMQALADSSTGVPVSIDFDPRLPPVGQVVSACVDDEGRLRIVADIDVAAFFWAWGHIAIDVWIVPGYTLPEHKATSYGITLHPQNKDLPPVSIL